MRSLALGVVLDPDTDGDGIGDAAEGRLGTNPNDPDTDDDGLQDGEELTYGTNPLDADSDDDGLNDGAEINLGTDPLGADSDLDGLNDGAEVAAGTNPLRDGTDTDGVLDGPDNCKLAANAGQENYDGDALGDACDNDDDNDGVADALDPSPRSDLRPTVVIGSCNTGVPNRPVSGGATMNDQVGSCFQSSTTKRAFDRCISNLASRWQRQKLISPAQKKAVLNCAAQTPFP